MNANHTIHEWDECFFEGLAFVTERGREQARQLSDAGIVEITELAQGLQVKSNSYIGRITLDGISLRIVPKLSGLPLAQLLCYAYDLKDKLHSQAKYETDSLDFFDLMIYTLHESSDHLIRHNFAKGYKLRDEELSAVRGRIDVRKIAAGGGVVSSVIPCRYHQREENTPLNQVLLSGLQLACHMASDTDLGYRIQKNIGFLKETVANVGLTDGAIKRAKNAVTRLTEEYGPIIDVIEMLYHMQAPQVDAEGSFMSLPGYFFDMNRFFEALVSKLMKTLPEEYNVMDQYRLKYLFGYDPQHNPNRRNAPTQRPDFALSKHGQIVQLFDAKYRDLWEKNLPPEMLYQLSVYAMSGVGNGKATILYPALSDSPEVQVIHIFHPIRNLKVAQIEMKALNLMKISDMIASGEENAIGQYMKEQIFSLIE